MDNKYYIPSPPKNIFKHEGTPEEGILKENTIHYIIEKISYDDGILVFYKDAPFPRKGFPTPEGVSAVNIVKKTFIEAIKVFSMWQFIFSWFISIFTYSTDITITNKKRRLINKGWAIEKILASFNRMSYATIAHHILKPEYMTPLASELQGLIFVFLSRLGISHGTSQQFALIFGTILEYDNAYRYRLEDIFSETTKEKLSNNPYNEFKRLLYIYVERERDPGVKAKVKKLGRLIALPLLLPAVKYSLQRALRNCEFNRLQLDLIDHYWCSMRYDYNFFGMSIEERMKGIKTPQGMKIVI